MVTRATKSHRQRSLLKLFIFANMPYIVVTLETSQYSTGGLQSEELVPSIIVAPKKRLNMSVILETSQFARSLL